MKKLFLATLFFIVLLWTGSMLAKPAPDYFISRYDIMNLDFLRTHYTQINNGRLLQITGRFSSFKWLAPYRYEQRLKELGLRASDYNLVQITLKEADDFHYSFPVLLVRASTTDLQELEHISKGTKMVIYGKFYNVRKSEYAIDTDLIELANVRLRVNIQGTPGYENAGHDREILLDARVAPTATTTATVTPTPPPSLWQRVNNLVNPKETVTATGTVTPGT